MTDSAEKITIRNGDHFVVEIAGEYHVLFNPSDLPHHFLSIARFQDKGRAETYCEIEADLLQDDLSAETPSLQNPDISTIKGMMKPVSPGSLLHVIDEFFGRHEWFEDMRRLEERRDATDPCPPAAIAAPPEPAKQERLAIIAATPEALPAAPAAPAVTPSMETPPTTAPSTEGDAGLTAALGGASSKSEAVSSAEQAPADQASAISLHPCGKAGGETQTEPAPAPLPMVSRNGMKLEDPEFSVGEWRIALSVMEAKLVHVLIRALKPLNRTEIEREIWGDRQMSAAAAGVLMNQTKKKISKLPVRIDVVPGLGWQLNRVEDTAPPVSPQKASIEPSMPRGAYADPQHLAKAQAKGAPFRLQIAGRYLIAGKHTIMVAKEGAAIAEFLIEKWGSEVQAEDLIARITARCQIANGKARAVMGTAIDRLNEDIEPSGLAVRKDKGWQFRIVDKERFTA